MMVKGRKERITLAIYIPHMGAQGVGQLIHPLYHGSLSHYQRTSSREVVQI